mgnify:CR=1 FL=1|tara:strand:- start:77351 stop:77809 length:459 start_codon:yes stop_codon:yes gene_type:complete
MDAIRVKKLDEAAVVPESANETDAGYDLVAIDDGEFKKDEHSNTLYIQYRTGLSIAPPPGYHTEIFPRSSISKTHLMLANSIGLIDEGYRGEILVRFKVIPSNMGASLVKRYQAGDRIAQLVIRKTEKASFELVEELDDTSRGDGGFGSSGT